MKITYHESPFNKEFGLMRSPDDFVNAIKKSGFVYIDTRFNTKTRIDVSAYLPGFCFGINEKVDGIKTAEKQEFNYFTSEYRIKNYFKIMKAQGLKKFEEYVSEIIKRTIVTEDVEIKIYETPVIRELRSKDEIPK